MKIHFNWFLLMGCAVIAGCSDEKAPVTATVKHPKAPMAQAPFRFHKLVEAAPGNDFDVLSWGRGSKHVGAFLILHSDSAGMDYTTTTGDLDGDIVDVYNADMDVDGNPELLIQSKTQDTTNYTKIYPFEFNGDKANKLDFPNLTNKQRQGYRGNDNFYIKEGKFVREFPIYEGEGKAAKPTGAKRVLEYGLRNNSFTVEQLSKDSTDKKVAEPVIKNQPKKEQVVEKRSSKKNSSSRSKKRDKKRRRHRR